MTLSRRSFVQSLGIGGAGIAAAGFISARGREAYAAERVRGRVGPAWWEEELTVGRVIRLSSNENPRGPSPAALAGIQAALSVASRYPFAPADELRHAIAVSHGVADDRILLGCGSTEILRIAVDAFTTRSRHLVTAAPTFEEAADRATMIGSPVRAIPVDKALKLDLGAMATASKGAGLVFVNNPNNPTGTLHPAKIVEDFTRRVLRESPTTVVLIDEAYHEYVEDPAYATAIPLALENPRVIVSRTFSKVHGIAGLRVGYAIGQADTLQKMARFRLDLAVNALGAGAAKGALSGAKTNVPRERQLNREARQFAQKWFETAGYRVTPSQANFFMVDIRRDSAGFQAQCHKQSLEVGRPFPPLKTHARISIGTMDEMRAAVEIFGRVLKSA